MKKEKDIFIPRLPFKVMELLKRGGTIKSKKKYIRALQKNVVLKSLEKEYPEVF